MLPADAGKGLAASSATWADGQRADSFRRQQDRRILYGHGRNQDLLTGQNLPGRKRKQRYIIPRPAAATAPSLVCVPFGFLTALIDIVLVLAPWTAKRSVGSVALEYLLAVLAQA